MYYVICQIHGEIGSYTSRRKASRAADKHALTPGHYGKWVKVIQTLLSAQKEIGSKSIKFQQEFVIYTVHGGEGKKS